uniref:RRM domain-containing protein n=1 Tax=Brassica oleracea var. oleracea TaxID=109376 RepID=A0A0D3CHP1_BRAOL
MMISYTSFESVVQLRTIFITGLPDDVKERELLNLLRWLPGYEASQVNFKGEKAHGFFSFLHGSVCIGSQRCSSEMAKKNLFVKIVSLVLSPIIFHLGVLLLFCRKCWGFKVSGYELVVTAHSVYSPSPFHHLPPPVWGPPHGYSCQMVRP